MKHLDKDKIKTILLVMIGILMVVALFIAVIAFQQRKAQQEVELTRDTRLVYQINAEAIASNLTYFYGIYNKTSYEQAKSHLKPYMSDSLYKEYFLDIDYNALELEPINCTMIKKVSRKLSDTDYIVKTTFKLKSENNNINIITVKVRVKNERIVEIV